MAEIRINGECHAFGSSREPSWIIDKPTSTEMIEIAKKDLYPIIRRALILKYAPDKMNELFGKDIIIDPRSGEYVYRKDLNISTMNDRTKNP